MLIGGGRLVSTGVGSETLSTASQAQASAAISEVGFALTIAGDSAGRSEKSPQSSSMSSMTAGTAGESM